MATNDGSSISSQYNISEIDGSVSSATLSSSNSINTVTQRTRSTRTRRKWDQNMNVAVVRSHFKALTENPDTYSKSLHKNFKETYPDLDVTAQRVLDQKRTIINKACTNTSGAGRAKKLLGAWISQAELDAIKAEADILYTGQNGHNQPSSNGNLDEVVRSDTVKHSEDNMADKNTQESEETTPINDPLTAEEEALHDRLKIKFEEAVLIEYRTNRYRMHGSC